MLLSLSCPSLCSVHLAQPTTLTANCPVSVGSLLPLCLLSFIFTPMSFSFSSAGFGRFELFEHGTFGEAEIASLLRHFPAFSSHPDKSEQALLVEALQELGKVETDRKERRARLRDTERQCWEAEEENEAMERSIDSLRETVSSHSLTQRSTYSACTAQRPESTAAGTRTGIVSTDRSAPLPTLCLSFRRVVVVCSSTGDERTASSSHKNRGRRRTRCWQHCTAVSPTAQSVVPSISLSFVLCYDIGGSCY